MSPPGVISVIVGEDDVRHVRQIDFQLAGVVQNGFRPRAGIEQDPMSVHHNERGEAPLSYAGRVGKHRRQHRHLNGLGPALLRARNSRQTHCREKHR
jgi:hypothetical protein